MKAEDTTSFTIPPALLVGIQAAADEEQRPAADVLQDAVTRYLREKRWERTLAYGVERAKALRLTQADVPCLIGESRSEQRGRRVFRTEDLTAAELEAIGTTEMDGRHDHLDAELNERAAS